MTSPFPLFRLPSVASDKVLKRMMLIDQLKLTFVSKKTKKYVQSLARRNSYSLTFEPHMVLYPVTPRMYFGYKNDSDYFGILTEDINRLKDSESPKSPLKVDDVTVILEFSLDYETVNAYGEEDADCYKNMFSYLCQIFNPVVSVSFEKESEQIISGILEVLEKEKPKISLIDYKTFSYFPGDYPKILNADLYARILNLPCEKLEISTDVENGFQLPENVVFKVDNLHIGNAHWVKRLDDFSNCKKIEICGSELKERDINQFLQKWLVSDYRLEHAEFEMDCSNFKSITEGLPVKATIEVDNDGKQYFEVQLQEGVKARIEYEPGKKWRGTLTITVIQ